MFMVLMVVKTEINSAPHLKLLYKFIKLFWVGTIFPMFKICHIVQALRFSQIQNTMRFDAGRRRKYIELFDRHHSFLSIRIRQPVTMVSKTQQRPQFGSDPMLRSSMRCLLARSLTSGGHFHRLLELAMSLPVTGSYCSLSDPPPP